MTRQMAEILHLLYLIIFPQFCQIDIFESEIRDKCPKYSRNFKHFNEREFLEELQSINWSDVTENCHNVNTNFATFLNEIETILNVMAPFKKITKRERLQQRPWITTMVILISMINRDKIYKQASLCTDPLDKRTLFNHFKKYHNLIVTLQRISKSKYFSDYFENHQKRY